MKSVTQDMGGNEFLSEVLLFQLRDIDLIREEEREIGFSFFDFIIVAYER